MSIKKASDHFDFMVKVVIIGDSAVGKTNILVRYVTDDYKISHIATIGVDFKVKIVDVDDVKIKMQIWDTAGQQRFKTITQTYYKGAAGVILVYSVADRRTFQNIQNWMNKIYQTQPQNMCKIIVANKSDLPEKQRQVSYEQGQKFARKYGLDFIQTSAKQNINIQQIFSLLAKKIKKQLTESQMAGNNKGNNVNLRKSDKKTIQQLHKNCEC